MLPYSDRRQAGRNLGELVARLPRRPTVVLGIPRGGVPVAFEVARAIHAPLDVFVVRKLGVPGHEELAMGAIASGGVRVLNRDIIAELAIRPDQIEEVARLEAIELRRREDAYRDGRPPVEVRGCRAVLVDDGLATGASMRAAVEAVRQLQPAEVIVAVPVGARESCSELDAEADTCICAATPEPFDGVGLWYRDFDPTTDREVRDLLASAAETRLSSAATEDGR